MPIEVLRLTAAEAGRYEALLRAAADSSESAAAAVQGFRASRQPHDWLRQDTLWLLLAQLEGQPAGAAVAVRLPKADARRGFLFVDELFTLPAFRRRGVASALLRQLRAVARAQGLAGVRLLVRPDNEPARGLYRLHGFSESPSLFLELPAE